MPYKLILNGKVIAILVTCLLMVKFFSFLSGIFLGLWIGHKAEEVRAALPPTVVEGESVPAATVAAPAPRAPVSSQPAVRTPVAPRVPQPRVSVTAWNRPGSRFGGKAFDNLAIDRLNEPARWQSEPFRSDDMVAEETGETWVESADPVLAAVDSPGLSAADEDAATFSAEPARFLAPVAREETAKLQPDDAYSFQVGAFRDRKNADSMARELRSRGYEARVILSPEDNGLLAVRVGKFPEREMATQAASVFRVNEQLPAWVRRSERSAD